MASECSMGMPGLGGASSTISGAAVSMTGEVEDILRVRGVAEDEEGVLSDSGSGRALGDASGPPNAAW